LSPARNGRIPDDLRNALAAAGFNEVLGFFDMVNDTLCLRVRYLILCQHKPSTTGVSLRKYTAVTNEKSLRSLKLIIL
jgi:hypothetical protein